MERNDRYDGDECARAQGALSAAIDGELGRAEAEALDTHLRQCPACRAIEREVREDWESLAAVPAPAAEDGEEFLAAVRTRLRRRRARTAWRLAAALAAAAAIPLAALPFWREQRPADAEFLRSLPVLVDLREETRDLDAELIGLLLDRLDEEPAPSGEADDASAIELELLLEEELEGMRS